MISKTKIAELDRDRFQFQEIKDGDSSAIVGGRGGRHRAIRNLNLGIDTNINVINITPIQISVNVLNQIALGNGKNIGLITTINHIDNIGVGISIS